MTSELMFTDTGPLDVAMVAAARKGISVWCVASSIEDDIGQSRQLKRRRQDKPLFVEPRLAAVVRGGAQIGVTESTKADRVFVPVVVPVADVLPFDQVDRVGQSPGRFELHGPHGVAVLAVDRIDQGVNFGRIRDVDRKCRTNWDWTGWPTRSG